MYIYIYIYICICIYIVFETDVIIGKRDYNWTNLICEIVTMKVNSIKKT